MLHAYSVYTCICHPETRLAATDMHADMQHSLSGGMTEKGLSMVEASVPQRYLSSYINCKKRRSAVVLVIAALEASH